MKNYGFDDFYGLLAESYVDKQVNKAARYIERNHSRLIGLERTQAGNPKTAKDLANDVKNQMPILVSKENNPKPGKFIVGASRIFYDEIDNNQRDVSPQLSRYIRTLIQDGHTDQFDEDLNGMSFEQLEQTFSKRTQEAGQNEKNEFSARKWERNPEYDIVRIDSTEEAKPYRRFLNPRMPWCITGSQQYYDSYTNGGLGVFYFVLKKGYENLKPVQGENSPHDEYGESMMAVAVDENGQLLNCTSRWNGSGDFFTAKQLSELLGVNFYDTFLPRSFEETVKKLDFRPAPDGLFPLLTKLGYMIPNKKAEDSGGGYAGSDWVKAGKPNYEKKEIDWVYYRSADLSPYGQRNDEYYIPEILYSRKTGRFASSEPIKKLKEEMIPPFYPGRPIPVFISKDITDIEDYYFSTLENAKFQVEEGNKRYFTENGCMYDREHEILRQYGERGAALIWADENLETLNVKEGTVVLNLQNSSGAKWKSVHLPDSVRFILRCCFEFTRKLSTINWPKSLQSIGQDAFKCSGIEEIDTTAIIHEHAFRECDKLKRVRVRLNADSRNAFGDSKIDYLEILPGTEHIGDSCFCRANIKELKFPEGLKRFGDSSFFGTKGFESIEFPSSVRSFGGCVFYNSRDLHSVKFNGGVSDFGYGLFEGCVCLENVDFGPTEPATRIGSHMFAQCISLTSMAIPSWCKEIGDFAFARCDGLESVFIPEGCEKIETSAFFGATNINYINLPASLKDIRSNVFFNAVIKTIYIQEGSPYLSSNYKRGSFLLAKSVLPATFGVGDNTTLEIYTDISQTPLAGLAQRGGGAPGAEEQLATESFSSFLVGRREGGSIPRRLKGF